MNLIKKISFTIFSFILVVFLISCKGNEAEGYKVNFVTDGNTVVTVYPTNQIKDGQETKEAYSKDFQTGKLLKDGNGDVYFSLKISKGYEISKFEFDSDSIEKIDEIENDKDLNLFVIKGVKKDLELNVVVSKVVEGFIITFEMDENVTVTVFDTQEYQAGQEVKSAFARNSETGEIDMSGDGQVNFKVSLKEGFEIANILATPTSNYKNLKLPSELGENTYRITKVTGEVVVAITTKEVGTATNEEGFQVTFDLDENVTVTIFETKDYTDGIVATTAYARDSLTGEIDISGEGQVNFKVNVKEGYELVNVLATPTANYKNLKLPSELGENTYRITKVTGEVVVAITTKEVGTATNEEGFQVTFDLDENVTVTIFETKDYTDGIVATTAYARDSLTGEIDISGEGQVNFKVNVKEGYELVNVLATPTANYKNLKLPDELGENTYRITKITGAVTVAVTTKKEGESSNIEGFKGTFVLDDNVIVTVYDAQDYENGKVTTLALARNSDTGEVDIGGNGQINFRVTLLEGYEVASITITPKDNYKNLKLPEELGENTYRITKMTGDITITIVTKPKGGTA